MKVEFTEKIQIRSASVQAELSPKTRTLEKRNSGTLRVFNTLTQRKEAFRSRHPGSVQMFVCGPTIQDFIHLGNARTYLFYDVFRRHLSYLGNNVELVLNITDIDESIVKGAKAEGSSIRAFTAKREAAFVADMGRLGIRDVVFDRVSSHVTEMISQVEGLLKRGHAYRVDGSVYFSIDSFADFGRLSRQSPYEISLRPLEVAEGKRNQADFSLWRDSGEDEQKWESPWGRGTPGWHIQDTAVSSSHFGPQYDVHGGARELVYPHHEAQIAEMEALSGKKPFVKYWVHSGLLTQRREKMAKSRGNVRRVREVLDKHPAGALRLYLLSMHHREDADFTDAGLRKWEKVYAELRKSAKLLRSLGGAGTKGGPRVRGFVEAMNDDLHADAAIGIMIKTVRQASKTKDPEEVSEAIGLLRLASSVLGVEMNEVD